MQLQSILVLRSNFASFAVKTVYQHKSSEILIIKKLCPCIVCMSCIVWFEQAEEMAAWQLAKEEEKKRLQRERAVLSKQSRALLKLPTRKDRAEVRLRRFTSNNPFGYIVDKSVM